MNDRRIEILVEAAEASRWEKRPNSWPFAQIRALCQLVLEHHKRIRELEEHVGTARPPD